MTKNFNDLQEIWKKQSIQQGDVNMELILKKSTDFKKSIMWRNFRECGIAFVMALVFIPKVFRAQSTWATLMYIELVLALIFVGVHIYLYGRNKKAPNYSASSTEHVTFLREQIQTQIKLLSNVRYWYLAPLLFGVLGLLGESLVNEIAAGKTPYALVPITFTLALNAIILWANEVWAVRKLKKQLEELPQI